MSFRQKQIELLKKTSKSYGGVLQRTRRGRQGPRPLATKLSMHLVLRSSKAIGLKSFKTPGNKKKIRNIINKFSSKYRVKIISLANVGNHLHLHLKLSYREGYKPFIRAVTAAIAMAIAGVNRWVKTKKEKFWDYRPFTRIILGYKGFLKMEDYIQVNQLEGLGLKRIFALDMLKRRWVRVDQTG